MSASTGSKQAAQREQASGCYVYGVVPADVDVADGTLGVGDPPGQVTVVRHGEIAALVGEIALDSPLGKPDDLLAHEQLLDAASAEAPVIPLRFGAVMTDPDAVVEELLAPYHDEFLAALRELEGRAEYIVKGRYVQDTLLREVLSENPKAARLRDQMRGRPPEATRNERIALGEIINQTVTAKRDADTRKLVERITPYCVAATIREPTHEEDAAHVAVLVETARQAELEDALRELGSDWADRIGLRLLGPLAPYDFVTARSQTGR